MPEFHADRTAGGLVEFDDSESALRLVPTGEIFSYDSVSDYEIVENRGPMGRGALARSFSSGFLSFVDGGYSVNALKLRLVFGGEERFLDLMRTPVKSNTIVFKNLVAKGEAVIAELRKICPVNSAGGGLGPDYTEELRRLKKLADEGVITEEEFKAKKKQILGL